MSMIDNELPENNRGMPTQGDAQSTSEEPQRVAQKSKPTQKQIDANRRNARFATGPKTAAGKKRVSRNAAKHFLTAKNVLDPRFESGLHSKSWLKRLARSTRPAALLKNCLSASSLLHSSIGLALGDSRLGILAWRRIERNAAR
jgi:hypothetical protein